MRRRLRLRHLPCLCRRGLAREGRRALADGRGHARFRLRRTAELATVVPDQGERRAQRARGRNAGATGLTQLSQLEGKGEQNQWGSIESLHYKTGTWGRADLCEDVMRGGGCGGKSSLSCLSSSFWSALSSV